nr:MAG TPA: AAA domain protein [Caudoviricetes sp.]
MTVGQIAALCGIPSALTVGIVGFLFWLLEHKIAKREAARVAQEEKLAAVREKQEQKLERERQTRDENRREFEKNLLLTSNAALALGEATARAVQRIPDAHCNGDMRDALNFAKKTKHEQRDFLAAQGIENIF